MSNFLIFNKDLETDNRYKKPHYTQIIRRTLAKIETPNFLKFSEFTKILRHNPKFGISRKNLEYSE